VIDDRPQRPARLSRFFDGNIGAREFHQVCLLEQPFRDTDRKIGDLISEKVAVLGENIRVARFVRMAVGENAAQASEDAEAA